MALNQVSGVPAGVLGVISYIILSYTRTFSNLEPLSFSKALALSYTHSKVGSDRIYIRGEWALRKWHWIKFLGYRLGC